MVRCQPSSAAQITCYSFMINVNLKTKFRVFTVLAGEENVFAMQTSAAICPQEAQLSTFLRFPKQQERKKSEFAFRNSDTLCCSVVSH